MMRPLLVTAALCAAAPISAQVATESTPSSVAACAEQRTAVAVAQALAVNVVVNRADAWLFDWDWARVDFGSWSKNLELGWQWDETQFTINMFVHPYHGSLYFDAARANCLTFWESIPITFLGSWTWEFFGEKWRPSLNDFWMTGYGGVAMGEMLHRVSAAVVDQEQGGGGRIGREIAATLINPLGGLNRLVRGQWTERGPNPADRLPESYLFRVKLGGRQVEEANSPRAASTSPTMLVEVAIGDVFDTPYHAPFDVVRMLAQVSPDGGNLNIMRAVGRLYGKELTSPDSWDRHEFLVNQRFDYVHNPVYRFGEQSLEIGLQSRWRIGDSGLRLNTRFAGDVVMLGAIDALNAGLGYRDIDYGPGLGAIAELTLDYGGTTYVSFYNRFRYLRSVSGAPANHTLVFSGLDLTVPITSRLGIGAYLSGDRRYSDYAELPTDNRSYLETRIYATWNIANGRPGEPR